MRILLPLIVCATLLVSSCSEGRASSSGDIKLKNIDSIAIVSASSGNAYVFRGEESFLAVVGMELKEGDLIKTDEDSFCQIRFGARALMRLESSGAVELDRVFSGQTDALVRLVIGDTVFKVEKKPQEDFVVKTDNNEFRVKGTVFAVRSGKFIDSVAVARGSVEASPIKRADKPRLVEAGGELFLPTDSAAELTGISASAGALLDHIMLDPIDSDDGYGILSIAVIRPAGAKLIVNGKEAVGSFSSLYKDGEAVSVFVGKTGYADQKLDYTIKGGAKIDVDITLEPVKTVATPGDSAIDSVWKDQEEVAPASAVSDTDSVQKMLDDMRKALIRANQKAEAAMKQWQAEHDWVERYRTIMNDPKKDPSKDNSDK